MLLLVHGALGDAEQMRPLADALDAVGRVSRVELPGHGCTPLAADAPFAMARFARAIGDAARDQRGGDDRPICVGYSMGGYAALVLEATQPGTLGGIVTLGTKFEWTPAAAASAAARLDAAVLQAKAPAFADHLRVRHAGAGGWELLLARTARLLTELGEDPLLTAQTLAAVQIPVRVAAGSRDDTLADGEAARLAALLPNAACRLLPDVPHPIERVPTALVVDLLRDFLRDLSRS